MNRPLRSVRLMAICCAAAVLLAGFTGCVQDPPKPAPPKYEPEANRAVPAFMKGTVYECTNLQNNQPFLVSGWGLVVNLDGTGGSNQVPNNVKAYMVKEMEKRG